MSSAAAVIGPLVMAGGGSCGCGWRGGPGALDTDPDSDRARTKSSRSTKTIANSTVALTTRPPLNTSESSRTINFMKPRGVPSRKLLRRSALACSADYWEPWVVVVAELAVSRGRWDSRPPTRIR